jgi:WD40 repeat protein
MKQRKRTYLVVLTLSVLLAGLLLAFWLWPEPETEQEPVFRGILRVSAMALSPDNKQLLVGYHIGDGFYTPAIGDKFLALWDLETGTEGRELKGHWGSVTLTTYFPDPHRGLSASIDDGTIRVWNLLTGQETDRIQAAPRWNFRHASLLPDGEQVVAATAQGMSLWKIRTGQVVHHFDLLGDHVSCVHCSPDGSHILSGGSHGGGQSVKLWSISSGKWIATFDGNASWQWAGTFTPCGRYLLTQRRRASPSLDSDLVIWNVQTGEIVQKLARPTSGVTAAYFTPDAKYILSATESAEMSILRLSEVKSGKEVWYQLSSIERMVLSSDGKFAITQTSLIDDPGQGTATGIRFDIWDVATGKRLRSIIRRPALDGTIH